MKWDITPYAAREARQTNVKGYRMSNGIKLPEPVMAQAKYKLSDWGLCTFEHHAMVQSDPSYASKGYETRLLFTQEQLCETVLVDRQSRNLASSEAEITRLKAIIKELSEAIHDQVVAQQSAWIEWQHGDGAESAMTWIHNGLLTRGFIPDENQPYGKEAQAWFDANQSHPSPQCSCGRPSNIEWMGQGFCCNEHYQQALTTSKQNTEQGGV
jgi:hypothetical protein